MLYTGLQYDTLTPDQTNECFNLVEHHMTAHGCRGYDIVLAPSGHGDGRSVVHIKHSSYAAHVEFPTQGRDSFRVVVIATKGCYDSRSIIVPNTDAAYSIIGLYLSNFIGAIK